MSCGYWRIRPSDLERVSVLGLSFLSDENHPLTEFMNPFLSFLGACLVSSFI